MGSLTPNLTADEVALLTDEAFLARLGDIAPQLQYELSTAQQTAGKTITNLGAIGPAVIEALAASEDLPRQQLAARLTSHP